jgi:hypothetical protein
MPTLEIIRKKDAKSAAFHVGQATSESIYRKHTLLPKHDELWSLSFHRTNNHRVLTCQGIQQIDGMDRQGQHILECVRLSQSLSSKSGMGPASGEKELAGRMTRQNIQYDIMGFCVVDVV